MNRRRPPFGGFYGAGPIGFPPRPMGAPVPLSGPGGYYGGGDTSGYGFRPPPFDQFLCEDLFPRIDTDESALTQVFSYVFLIDCADLIFAQTCANVF